MNESYITLNFALIINISSFEFSSPAHGVNDSFAFVVAAVNFSVPIIISYKLYKVRSYTITNTTNTTKFFEGGESEQETPSH